MVKILFLLYKTKSTAEKKYFLGPILALYKEEKFLQWGVKNSPITIL